jgi:hypothetical protein
LNEVNVVLAAGQVGATNLATMASAIGTMPTKTTAALAARVDAALLMVLTSPQYIVQK